MSVENEQFKPFSVVSQKQELMPAAGVETATADLEGLTKINDLAKQIEIENSLAQMVEQNSLYSQAEQKEIIPPQRHITEHSSPTQEELTLKNIWKLRKEDPKKARDIFYRMLYKEHEKGRLTQAQLKKFLYEAEYVDFRVIARDLLVTYSLEIPALIASGIGFGLGVPIPVLSTVSPAGILRSPYLLGRSVQEFNKIAKHEGIKSAVRKIPYFTGANLINLINFISPLGTLMVSFPRNKDVGLAFINHKVQNSKAPSVLKKGINGLIQSFYEKPGKKASFRPPVLKPAGA
jgi:phage antirepressor YoqD-like protein